MKSKIERLGKVSITVEKDYWDKNKAYNRLTIVERQGTSTAYLSRKVVPIGVEITDRNYWITISKWADIPYEIVQEFGDSPEVVISQKVVTLKVNELQELIDNINDIIGEGGSIDERISTAKSELKSEIVDGASEEGDTFKKIEDRLSDVEMSVGEGGSIDERIAEESTKHYTKEETYNKTELNSMITTSNQQYVTVEATSETTDVHSVLPTTGAADTVYRVGNWDGTQYDVTSYAEYSWNGADYVHLSTKTQVGEVFDISAYRATGGTPAQYADLAAALDGGDNVPEDIRKGGMSIKFIQSDNKYVQYFLRKQTFSTNVSDWEEMSNVRPINVKGYTPFTDINSHIKELYITGDNSNVNMVFCQLEITSNSIRVAFITDDTSKRYFFCELKLSGTPQTGVVYKLKNTATYYSTTDITVYIVLSDVTTFNVQHLSTSDYIYDFAFNSCYSNIISSYIVEHGNDIAFTNQYAADKYIKELFIIGGDKDKCTGLNKLQIASNYINVIFRGDSEDNVFWSQISVTPQANVVYKLQNTSSSNNYDIVVYVVFKKIETINFTFSYKVIPNYCFYLNGNGMINEYILNGNNLLATDHSIKFVNNNNANKYIEELYIPTIADYHSPYLKRMYIRKNGECRLFIADGNSNEVFILLGTNVTEKYYDYGSITPLYLNNNGYTPTLLGWIKFKYAGTDYFASNEHFDINTTTVSNIDNSPKIKSMLNNNKQVLIWGDSKLGYIDDGNTFQDMLQGLLGMRVYQCGFGGCRMSWRTADGSNNYDKFSAVDLADAWADNDFTAQIAAYNSVKASTNYYKQIHDMQDIDFSKETFVLLNYLGNDFTGGSAIGDLFVKQTQITDYDKTTYLGAMNYAVQRLSTEYPSLAIATLPTEYHLYQDNNEYLTVYDAENNQNIKCIDYIDALQQNTHKLGLTYIDLLNWNIANYFSLLNGVPTLAIDGHFNAYGYSMIAKWMAKQINLAFNI